MADSYVYMPGSKGPTKVKAVDNGDGTYSLSIGGSSSPDLKIGCKSLALTLSSGVGSVPIPDTTYLIGIKPVSSTSIRIGLEAPEADGAVTGTGAAGDLKKGFPVDAAVWTWVYIGGGASRTLYVKGGASDVLEVAVL